MSWLDSFWEQIDAQVAELRQARTVDRVMEILGARPDAGEAFFAGSGGDDQLTEILAYAAGWRISWWEAVYYACLEAPEPSADGSMHLTYIEGDVIRGHQRPLPHGEGRPSEEAEL